MDLKSILRAFRYGELQATADRDPTKKRPPTIMFLGLVLALGLAVVGVAVILADADPGDAGRNLEVTQATPTTTPSSPATTTAAGEPTRESARNIRQVDAGWNSAASAGGSTTTLSTFTHLMEGPNSTGDHGGAWQ